MHLTKKSSYFSIASYDQSNSNFPNSMRQIQLEVISNNNQGSNACSFTSGDTNNLERRIFVTFDDFGTPDFNLGSTFLIGMAGKQIIVKAVYSDLLDMKNARVVITLPPPPSA
jgi:hypothetical protein